MDTLITLDHQLMQLLNFDGGPAFDFLMYWISYKWTLVPVYLLVLLALWRKSHGWKRWLLAVACIALAVVLADQISSGLIKPWAERLRPSKDPLISNLLHYVGDYRGGGRFGFVSSHAANTSAVGVLLWSIFRSRAAHALILLWVALTCYSRIYLGVHYPGDILGGLAVGLLSGTLATLLHQATLKWLR